MLHIHHTEDPDGADPRSPSKLYADTCWATNPRLSPDWWREALGHTVGKLALDWRTHITQPEHLLTGCNLVLASDTTWPAVAAALNRTPAADAYVTILITPDPHRLPPPHPRLLVWNAPDTTPEHRLTTLIHLENKVKNGDIEAYGIVPGNHPLHLWLEEAAESAQTVYQRRKRPALRLLVAPFDLLDLTLLTHENTTHKSEPVSTLELAARLGLAVIALAPSLPQEAEIPESIQVLTSAAEAENTLNHTLGGWPQIHGQPLFSLLAHLAHGQTPWPTPHHWHNWLTHVWPTLQTHWHSLPPSPAITTYLAALTNLLPHGSVLALASAQPHLYKVLEDLHPRFPAPYQSQSPLTQALALLSSIPGLTAVAPGVPFNPNPLQQFPNLPDVGALLLA